MDPVTFTGSIGGRDADAGPRHGWVWAVLPADCRRVEVIGDAELGILLRAAGVRDVTDVSASPDAPRADAILIGDDRGGIGDLDPLARRLEPGGVLALTVGGNAPRTERASVLRRALQEAGVPARALATRREARRLRHRLDAAGLQTRLIPTGERWGVHPLGIGDAHAFAARGAIVAGSAGEERPGVLERALYEAGEALGGTPGIVDATVRGSGALLVRISTADAGDRILRLAAGPAARLLDLSVGNLRAIEAAGSDAIRERLVLPLAEGNAGLARWAVERMIPGRHPGRMRSALWRECLDFLIALRSVQVGEGTAAQQGVADGLAADARALTPHLDDRERSTLQELERSLHDRLVELPLGWAHGDFWAGNLLARRGRLMAVIDWDAARPSGLPLLDLLHLIALGERRTRRLPHGRRCSEALWPLARDGGDERVRAYCEATGTPGDLDTLEALAIAYWLSRVGRDLRTFADRAGRRTWMAENVHRPLAALGNR